MVFYVIYAVAFVVRMLLPIVMFLFNARWWFANADYWSGFTMLLIALVLLLINIAVMFFCYDISDYTNQCLSKILMERAYNSYKEWDKKASQKFQNELSSNAIEPTPNLTEVEKFGVSEYYNSTDYVNPKSIRKFGSFNVSISDPQYRQKLLSYHDEQRTIYFNSMTRKWYDAVFQLRINVCNTKEEYVYYSKNYPISMENISNTVWRWCHLDYNKHYNRCEGNITFAPTILADIPWTPDGAYAFSYDNSIYNDSLEKTFWKHTFIDYIYLDEPLNRILDCSKCSEYEKMLLYLISIYRRGYKSRIELNIEYISPSLSKHGVAKLSRLRHFIESNLVGKVTSNSKHSRTLADVMREFQSIVDRLHAKVNQT
jgi:hypothetical protein